jgi:ABC-type transporter MlaC component
MFTVKLKQDLLKTLLSKLLQTSTGSFQFVYARRIQNNVISIGLKVNGYTRYDIYIDLLLHKNKQNDWKIFDVALNNDSLVDYYQTKMLIKIRRYGFNQALNKF